MSSEKSGWQKNPLVNMIIGFILTGVLGTAVTQHFIGQREQEKLRAQRTIDRKEAIKYFTELNEERNVRAEILLGALRGNLNDEDIKIARQEYEKAYVAWSVGRPGGLLLIRDLLSKGDYQLVEKGFQESLVGKILNPISLCLSASLQLGTDREAINQTLDVCGIDELIEFSRTCSLSLATAVSDLAGVHSEWGSTKEIAELQEQARESISKQCP